MIKVKYILKDGSKDWVYEMKDLRNAVECIKEDMAELATEIAMVIVFDEENNKIFEVK
jgi:hypothetical protein|nr:MAG TPA_asm: hypothetical protein [Caudoviricetes sp.]